jgi:transcriptional regulator with XRE-family HTH domain
VTEIAEFFRSRLSKRLSERGAKSAFCRKTGISRSLLDQWIRGESVPGLDSLERVASGLDVTPWDLIKPEGSEPSHSPAIASLAAIIPAISDDEAEKLRSLLGAIRQEPFLKLDHAKKVTR